MPHELVRPPKARRGDRVAVLSPSFAAAGAFPAVHEQAIRRLAEVTGLVPVEFPATRKVCARASKCGHGEPKLITPQTQLKEEIDAVSGTGAPRVAAQT